MDCPNCGAKLSVDPGLPHATCQYCKTTSVIQRGNKPAKLPQWQPPAGAALPPGSPYGAPMPQMVPMVIRVPRSSFSGWWLWFTIIMIVVPMLAAFIPVLASSGILAPGWDGKEPFSCGANDRYKIDDVKADLKGTAMSIGGNCQVELRNVDIKGKVGANISGNGRLTLFSGTIEGKTTGIEVGGNGRVVLHEGLVKGSGYAIDASINADVQTGEAKIKGKLKAEHNARIDGKKP